MTRLSILAVLALVACGSPQAPAPPSAPPAAPPASSVAEAPAPSAEPAPAPKRHRPYEIHSSCADVVTLLFGDDPKTAGKRTINEGGTIDGPRDDNGNMTIWLVDAHGQPTTKVQVTRGMKKVEIGRSCSTLDAR